MDPMANLDGGTAPGATADVSASTKDVFDPIALSFNLKRIDKIRSFMGIASGCVAGIFGLTGLQGLGAVALWLCGVIMYVLCSFSPHTSLVTFYPFFSLFLIIAFVGVSVHVGL